jgi:Flp pilus assembly protein TadG
MRHDLSTQNRQRGAVLVELAVVMPILLFLFVGVVDYGLILREYQILQNGAREGARLSMLPAYKIEGTTAQQNAKRDTIRQRVVDYLATEQITIALSDVTVNQTTTIDMGGGLLAGASKVTVNYNRTLLIGNGWPFGPVSLRGEATFRNLY